MNAPGEPDRAPPERTRLTASAEPSESEPGSSWLRRWYGSGRAHLVAIVLGGLVGTYAASKLLDADPLGVALWFTAAAVLHDLVLVPVYCGLDRVARAAVGGHGAGSTGLPFWYDHLRVPVLLSGLLLLVFFPLIFRIPPGFDSITGTPVDVYLGRYLALVAGLFLVSALALVVRVAVRMTRTPSDGP